MPSVLFLIGSCKYDCYYNSIITHKFVRIVYVRLIGVQYLRRVWKREKVYFNICVDVKFSFRR